jgi:endonuclease YncB( thermonuclease family)
MPVVRTIRQNLSFVAFLAVLGLCSAFFTYRVEAMRAKVAKARSSEDVPSGTEVTVLEAIDGDELTVRPPSGQPFVVRLLGIKAFNPATHDPETGAFARSCLSQLQELVGKRVVVEYEELKRDRSGRILAYLRRGELDVALELVKRGLVPVFVKYPFSRETEYRAAQVSARRDRQGLWGHRGARSHTDVLLSTWEAARE